MTIVLLFFSVVSLEPVSRQVLSLLISEQQRIAEFVEEFVDISCSWLY